MAEYTGILVYAGLANLQKESVSTFAGQATAEREAVNTFAGWPRLQHELVLTFAVNSTFEATSEDLIITFAALCTLEAPADVKRTFASITDLIYYVAPPLQIETKIVDRRSDSGGVKYPVYQSTHKFVIETGLLEVSFRLTDNVEIKQITFSTPDCDGGTAKVQLIDRIGAEIYASGDQAQSTIAALITTAGQSIPIVPGTTLKVVVSKTQAAPIQFVVILYGI